MAASSIQALSSLLQQTTLDNHEEILRAANEVLNNSRGNIEAQHVKAVALLNLDRFNDALQVFESGGDKLKEAGSLGYAYALYKAGNLEEAEKVAERSEKSRGMLHVLAQTSYRSEKFEQAAATYRTLKANPPEVENEANDLRINIGAVDAQLEWAGLGHIVENRKAAREDLEAFETAFNAACGSIARGELAQGDILLQRAKALCNTLDEEERKTELIPIVVQQIYLLSKQGKFEEAEQLCSTLELNDISDISTRHIAQTNMLAASNQVTNPFLSHRIFHTADNLKGPNKLFKFQEYVFHKDAYVMDLLSMKYDGVIRSTASHIAKNAASITSPEVAGVSVLNAAAHAKGQAGKAALKAILPLLEKRQNDIGLLLTAVHLYVQANNYPSALNLVEVFLRRLESSSESTDLDIRYNPGLVGTLASLYASQGRRSQIRSELVKAALHWRKRSQNPPSSLLKAAGSALLNSTRNEDLAAAGEIFSILDEQDKNDNVVIAGLVAAFANVDSTKITSAHIETLPPTARLITGIDAAALEDTGIPIIGTSIGSTAAISGKRPVSTKAKTERSRKIRKSRLPKEYNENKKPDPERWLPLRDRTYYKPKGKKGKAKMAGLTQGGVVSEEKGEAAKTTPAAVASGAGGGGAAKKKKKGKGGKW